MKSLQFSFTPQLRFASLLAALRRATGGHPTKKLRSIAIAGAAAVLATMPGCVTVKKAGVQIAPVGQTAQSKITAPVSIKVTCTKSSDEDLRASLQTEVMADFAKANIATTETGASVVIVDIVDFNRVSKFNRLMWGQMAGVVKYHATISFGSESLKIDGNGRLSLGPRGLGDDTTEDAIKQLAQAVTEATKARL